MDYEERLKDIINSNKTPIVDIDTFLKYFPELKESEDERIKEDIITYLSTVEDKELIPYESWIAWLEKQDECHISHDDEIMIEQLTEYFTTGHGLQNTNDTVVEWLADVKRKFEKQGEQKSLNNVVKEITKNKETATSFLKSCGIMNTNGELADEYKVKQNEHKPFDYENGNIQQKDFAPKIEPKFKDGDWIVYNDNLYHIGNIALQRYYECLRVDGTVHTFSLDIDSKSHLWTIKDAKDGDVLCCESGWTCIFKALDNHTNTFSSYCFMDNTKWFCETGCKCHTLKEEFSKVYNGKIYPATKEQCDTLMKVMADAGYTFDFERKTIR